MRFAVLCAALAGPAALAQANYLPFKMLHTAGSPFRYYLDARNTAPGGLSLTSVETATTRAWRQWDDLTCSSLAFSYQGSTSGTVPNPTDPYDVYNVSTVWIPTRTEPMYATLFSGRGVVAAALPLTYAGVLQQCDIFLNSADYAFSTNATTPANTVDVESVIAHEAGHCMGLDHGYTSDKDVMHPVTPIGFARRALQTYDSQALCARYPASGGVGSPCSGGGACGTGGLRCVQVALPDGGAGPSYCTNGCAVGTNAPCEIPFVCRPSTAFSPSFNGACLPPVDSVTLVGKPCFNNVECGSNFGVCLREGTLPSGFPAWKSGYCSQDCALGRPACPAGSSCVDMGGQFLCMKNCRVGLGDCRADYTCVLQPMAPTAPGVCASSCHGDVDCNAPGANDSLCRVCDGTCLGRQNPSGQLGDLCTGSSQCGPGQVCLPMRPDAGTVGFCSSSCALDCAGCPSGSGCFNFGPRGERFCLRSCTGPGTCPGGLQCVQVGPELACVPPCQTDPECPVGTRCVAGQCTGPSTDGGCVLCGGPPDAGEAPVPDGGEGTGPANPGGCGCGSGAGGALGWLGFLAFRGRSKARFRKRSLSHA